MRTKMNDEDATRSGVDARCRVVRSIDRTERDEVTKRKSLRIGVHHADGVVWEAVSPW